MSIARVTEITATSRESFDDALRQGVNRASKTLKNIKGAWIKEQEVGRVNAELPDADFRPSPGRITQWDPPEGPGIRVDTHCFPGYWVPPYYDSLLAKLIVTGDTRAEVIELMRHSLTKFSVSGVDTTIHFLSSLIDRTDYLSGQINTRWLEEVVGSEGAESG